METFNSNKQKFMFGLVFGIYFICLCWLVLFKLATSVEEIPNMRGLNIIPFYYDNKDVVGFHLREVMTNILVFIPAGVYFTAVFGKSKAWIGVFLTFVLSLIFESMQWILSIGATDITDLITNTLGGTCGMMLFLLMGKIWKSSRISIINGIGAGAELLGGTFLTLMLCVNY